MASDIRTLAPETLSVLQGYDWPGNVRELESVMKQSLLTARGNILLSDFLPPLGDVDDPQTGSDDSRFLSSRFIADRLEAGTDNLYAEAISLAERQLLRHVLTHTAGNQLKAATLLGISRVTLRSKLKSLKIDASDFSG
ncbi:MAG: helix-turn-helix domain-containing protein [Pirellulaceae bacterium]